MEYLVLLCIFGAPLSICLFNFGKLCVLIWKCFFSGFIKTNGTICDYKSDKNGCYRIYEYSVQNQKVKGKAFGTCKKISCGREQLIKYNPNNFNDVYVINDIYVSFLYFLIGLVVVVFLNFLLKFSFFPDTFFMALWLLGISVMFKIINYLIKKISNKKIVDELKLSNIGVSFGDSSSQNESSISGFHFVLADPNSVNLENEILNNILADDKNFTKTLFRQQAILYFREIYKAYKFNNFDVLKVFVTDNFFKSNCNPFNGLDINKYDFSDFLSFNIVEYNVENGIEMLDYQICVRWENISEDSILVSTYYMQFIRKCGVVTKVVDNVESINCPNCGADTSVTSVGKCIHCDQVINTGNFCWNLNYMCYWDER